MRYDAYGGIQSSTLTPELTAVFDNADATGLTHLGNGRYYDPTLGRPLQPSASGGIPVVPQSLNRYTATGLGQVGVAAGAASGLNLWPDAFGLVKGTALDLAEFIRIEQGVTFYRGQARVTIQASHSKITKTFFRYNEWFFDGFDKVPSHGVYQTTAIIPIGSRTKDGLAVAADTVVADMRSRLGYSPKRINVTAKVIEGRHIPHYVKLGTFRGFKYLKFGLGPAFDAGLGGYLQYLDDRDNPFLTPGQKGLRAIVAGGGSLLTTLGVAAVFGCGVSLVCGISASVVGTAAWVFIGQPLIFDTIFPSLSQLERRLKPF